jgi:hypothetical protein
LFFKTFCIIYDADMPGRAFAQPFSGTAASILRVLKLAEWAGAAEILGILGDGVAV